jgi:hypothetical protein
MQKTAEPNGETEWNRVRPVLDELMLRLSDRDREALVLRFFGGLPLAEMARRFHLTEDGARLRVNRAVDKMRRLLTRKGIHSTGAALAAALGSQTGVAAPATLTGALTSTVLRQLSAINGASATGLSFFGFLTGSKTALVIVGAAMLIGAGTVYRWAHPAHSLSPHRSIMPTGQLDQSGAPSGAAPVSKNDRRPTLSATPSGKDRPQGRGLDSAPKQDGGMAVSNADLEEGIVRIHSLANVGCATPRAAMESLLWAIVQGTKDDIAKMLVLSQSQKVQLNAVLASLPEAARAEYSEPEHLIALDAAYQGTIFPSDGVIQIVSETTKDASDVSIRFTIRGDYGAQPELPKDNLSELELVNGPSGWKAVVPNYVVTKLIGTITGSAGGKN